MVSSCAESSAIPFLPCVSTTPITTSSPRLCRRIASLNMLNVLPTPGAYPRKSFSAPFVFSAGFAAASHCSGVFGIGVFSSTNAMKATLEWQRARALVHSISAISRRFRFGSRYFSRLSPHPDRQSHYRRALFSARHSSRFHRMGHRRFRVHVRGGHARLQLLFPATRRPLHRGRPPELGRALRFSRRLRPGQPPLHPRPPESRRRLAASPRNRKALLLQPGLALIRQRNPIAQPHSVADRGHLRSRRRRFAARRKTKNLPLRPGRRQTRPRNPEYCRPSRRARDRHSQ